MIDMIGLAFNEIFYYVSTFLSWILNRDTVNRHLLPLFFIGVAVSVIFVVFKIIKSTIWGR